MTAFSPPTARSRTTRYRHFIYFNSWEQVSLTHSVTTSSVSSVARPWLSWVNASSLSCFNLGKRKKSTRVIFKNKNKCQHPLQSWKLGFELCCLTRQGHPSEITRQATQPHTLQLPWPPPFPPTPAVGEGCCSQGGYGLGPPSITWAAVYEGTRWTMGLMPVQWPKERASQARVGSVLCSHTLTSRALQEQDTLTSPLQPAASPPPFAPFP